MKIAVTKLYKNSIGTYSTGYGSLKYFKNEQDAKKYCEKKNKKYKNGRIFYKIIYLN